MLLKLNYLILSSHDSQLFSFSFSFFKHDFSFNFNPSFSSIFNPRSSLSVSFHSRFSPQLEVYCNFSRVYEYRNGAKIDTSRHFILPRNRRNYRIQLYMHTCMLRIKKLLLLSGLYSCDQPFAFPFPRFPNKVSRFCEIEVFAGVRSCWLCLLAHDTVKTVVIYSIELN